MAEKVLVTGISGYIGMHCAAELLAKGYKVKGSVRNINKTDGIRENLEKLNNTSIELEFCELDLLKDKGWDTAMSDCDYVLHVASPYISREPKNENDLIQPAVEGTLRALKAASKAKVKRMVLTSSMVSMLGDASKSIHINDKTWTDVDSKYATAYLKSKTLAEKTAWNFIENHDSNLQLVVINPGPVYGPPLRDDLSGESMSMYKNMISGKIPFLPKTSINMSDVRDIAKIEVLALENEKASGNRFIVASESPYTFQDMARIMKKNGYDKVKTKTISNKLIKFLALFSQDLKGMLPFIGKTYIADIEKTEKTFNWTPIPLKQTVLDTAKAVKKRM